MYKQITTTSSKWTFGTSFPSVMFKAGYSRNEDLTRYYQILNVNTNSDQEEVRKSFLKLVKKFHPDSGSPQASPEKFHEIEHAYRKIQVKFAKERWNKDNELGEYGLYHPEKECDINHTAPQHRQYLDFGGYGYGTPQQRQKQYQKFRARTAIENVNAHRISQLTQTHEAALINKDKKEAKKIKTRSEMERLVEDLIQESMARGEFDNLSGQGKPLPHRTPNPYVDFVTQKMNEVLIDNGFTPEWITLQKEIDHDIQNIRTILLSEREKLGVLPLVGDDIRKWQDALASVEDHVKRLNKKINSFNLQVPLLNKQRVLFQLYKEADRILENGRTKFDVPKVTKEETKSDGLRDIENNPTLLGLFYHLFPHQNKG